MLRQRPFRCLTQPVTTPESNLSNCRVLLESLSLKKDRRSLQVVLLSKGNIGDMKEDAKARRRPSPPVTKKSRTSLWMAKLHTHENAPHRTCQRAVGFFYFSATTGTGSAREFGDLHSRTVVSASISWKTSSSGFAGCGVWRQGRTCLIPANFLESRMGITQRVVRRICN